MGRNIRNYESSKVEDSPVAPHRYRADVYKPDPKSYDEWKKQIPYKPGEVVYMDDFGKPVKAKIIYVFRDHDRFGFPREKYRVQKATQKGLWSKNWIYIYPGFIQRGYKLAGLAPEMKDD